LIGGIDINPIDLNQTYNSLEVQYPNSNINDQTDYKVVDLTTVGTAWYDPSLLSPNEPDNRLTIQYPQINNYIRAVYLGVRRLLQSREDLTIACNLDYSGIQVVAGDVVRVTLAEYGWTDKLFRVSQVQETKTSDGFLGARITAFEYNGSIYADNALEDFIPEANTGLTDPNIIGVPGTPSAAINPLSNGNVKSFNVTSTVPSTGSVLYMDFNYGTSSNVSTHVLYKTVSKGNGTPYTAGEVASIEVADAAAATYYISTTARNTLAGRPSASSAPFVWGGPNVTNFDPALDQGGITYNNMQPNAAGFLAYEGFDPRTALPVVVTSTANRNVPLIFPGVTVAANDVFPWYQGTGVGSTGSWTPSATQVQLISPEGTDGWYKAIYVDLQYDNLLSTEIGQLWATLGFLGDVNNIQFQLCRYAIFTGGVDIALQTRSLGTYFTGFKQPYPTRVSLSDWASGSLTAGGIYEWGWMIRNITPGSNLTMFQGSLAVKQQKLNP
jgi:hypothetical protein